MRPTANFDTGIRNQTNDATTVIIIFLLYSFIGWMQFTPGHFQRGCACCSSTIIYAQRIACEPCMTLCIAAGATPFQSVLLFFGRHDLSP